jgi:beta-N-acetylhexosaminidase
MVMVGHLSAPEVTGDDTPSDLSPVIVTDILRKELGFQGVIVTDAQNMGAITDYYDSAEAAVAALEAGVDMILVPEDLTEAVDGVLAAVESGKISEERIAESVTRILALKYEYGLMT